MSFVHRLFSSKSPPKTITINEAPLDLSFVLSSFRWHLDSRPPSKAILLHDFMSSSHWWQQVLHDGLDRLPTSHLTPKVPLELYALDLRGHNCSMRLPYPTQGQRYTLACAADVLHHQRHVLRSDAMLVGVGFGALVACQAALSSPERGMDSLTLIVSHPSQLLSCDPTKYALASIIKNIPKTTKTLADLNLYLTNTVSNPIERAVILSAAEKIDGAMTLRFSAELFRFETPLKGVDSLSCEVQFKKRVTVVQCFDGDFQPEVKKLFMRNFPNTTFTRFQGDTALGIGSLYSQSDSVARTLLGAMDLLTELGEASEF